MFSLETACELPIAFILLATPSSASSASILNAFIALTKPSVAFSISTPGEIEAKIEDVLAIVSASLIEYPKRDHSAAALITSLVVTPNCLAVSFAV